MALSIDIYTVDHEESLYGARLDFECRRLRCTKRMASASDIRLADVSLFVSLRWSWHPASLQGTATALAATRTASAACLPR